MSVRYLSLSEATERTGLAPGFFQMLASEDLIQLKRTLDDVVVVSSHDVERARVIALLTEELDVNLPGAEVILRMRDDMIAMQRQFEEILASLVTELRRGLATPPPHDRDHDIDEET
jgi:MerR family transcriptional regulator/heat shock protein HspR